MWWERLYRGSLHGMGYGAASLADLSASGDVFGLRHAKSLLDQQGEVTILDVGAHTGDFAAEA